MLKPIDGSQQILELLSKKYDLFIASAAMQYPNSLKEKSDWLDIKFLPNAESLNITIEPEGGSEHPTVSRLVASANIRA